MADAFNFDNTPDRRGTGSYKWDTPATDDILPLWVADMDFAAAPCIMDALRQRLEHGVFGYTKVGADYYDAVTSWFERRHGWKISPDTIIYTSGVVPAISAIIKAVTRPGDRVVVQTPAYNCFFSSIRNNGCELAANRLIYSPEGYSIDFENLEELCADPTTTAMILCNPHNPGGRVWTAAELRRIGDICLKHNVFVIADEIHCELTFDGHCYTPYATLGEKYAAASASCISPSKAFNIAGLQIANIVAVDPERRAAIDKAININEVCDVNPFGVVATIAAYNQGLPWLTALKSYIWQNYEYLRDAVGHLPQYKLMKLEGTYLAWLDCSATGISSEEIERKLESEAKVMLSPGEIYGAGGETFMRINLACSRAILAEAIGRMLPVLQSLTNCK